MKSRWKIGLALGVAGLIAAGWILLGHSREPRYQGRPVSYWFKEYYLDQQRKSPEHNQFEAAAAFKEMGAKALPYLLKQAFNTKQDTTIVLEFYQLLGRLPDSWHLPEYVSWDAIRQEAVSAIHEIELPASVILPLVRKELDETNTPNHNQAIRILSGIREGAEILVPQFAKALHDEDDDSRKNAAEALGELGPAAKAAIPDLMYCLREPEDNLGIAGFGIHVKAAGTLGSIGSNSAPAIPLLLECFHKETNREDRFDFATALCRIDARQTNALGFLIEGLINPKSQDEPREIASRLGKIGTNARPAIPALLEALNTTNEADFERIAGALKDIGTPNELYLPQLREKLHSTDEDLSMAAAGMIFLIDKKDGELRAYMIDQIRNHRIYEFLAVENLPDTGQSPEAIIPIIAVAFEGTNVVSWASAGSTLKKLGAPPEMYMPKLKEALKSNNEKVRAIAARTILDLAPGDNDALLVMIDLAKGSPRYAAGAITRLGKVGPAAKEAIPVLKNALKSKDAKVRRAAAEALEKIEAKDKAK